MPKRSRSHKIGLYKRLLDDAEALAYLQVAAEDSIPALLIAVRNVAEARQMSHVAKESNLDRAHLYRMLREGGNPTLTSLGAVLHTFGFRFSIENESHAGSIPKVQAVRSDDNTHVIPFPARRSPWLNTSRSISRWGFQSNSDYEWDEDFAEGFNSTMDEAQLLEA